MFDWDAVIIGGGPAGLTAGLYLARANYRTIIVEKESLGGVTKNVDLIENYPGFPDGIAGVSLVNAMTSQAVKFGLKTEIAEVTSIECFSNCRWVGCSDGRGYTTALIIIAAGSRQKRLGIPGEELLRGKGVFDCALCDGGQFVGKTVVVCGGGEAAVSEAIYMSRLSSKVILVHRRDTLRAAGILQSRVMAQRNIELVWNSVIEKINGDGQVNSVTIRNTKENNVHDIPTDGVLVQIGTEPATAILNGLLPLDANGYVLTSKDMETEVPYILAAGDIRNESPRQVSTAVGDGAIAGITAQRILREIG